MAFKDFELLFISRSEFEHLYIEIQYQGIQVCEINKEKGNSQMEIVFSPNLLLEMKFPFIQFLAVLNEAKHELSKC